jgi:mono/diheme cytochrome c family protein
LKIFLLFIFLFTACQPFMNHQPKIKVYSEATPDQVQDTFSYVKDGVKENARPTLTLESLRRGHERFDIYCKVCHGVLGDGKGIVTLHGFSLPPSFHSDQVRKLSDQDIFSIITDGKDRMKKLGDRISESDRWNIVSYVRALQISQNPKAQGMKK